jgi:hypothetical protein
VKDCQYPIIDLYPSLSYQESPNVFAYGYKFEPMGYAPHKYAQTTAKTRVHNSVGQLTNILAQVVCRDIDALFDGTGGPFPLW